MPRKKLTSTERFPIGLLLDAWQDVEEVPEDLEHPLTLDGSDDVLEEVEEVLESGEPLEKKAEEVEEDLEDSEEESVDAILPTKKERERMTADDLRLGLSRSSSLRRISSFTTDLFEAPLTSQSVNLQKHGLFPQGIMFAFSSKLLMHTAYGDQAIVEDLIGSSFPRTKYLFTYGEVQDLSGRTFNHISPFQYALWAGDTHMWRMMLRCLQKGFAKHPKEAEDLRLRSLEQFEQLQSNGVTYSYMGSNITESHFDLQPLINALKDCIKHSEDWTTQQLKNYWCKIVGSEQSKLPAQAAQEYSRQDRSFSPIPYFQEDDLPRTLTVYHCLKGKELSWWHKDSENNQLGTRYAIYRGANRFEAYASEYPRFLPSDGSSSDIGIDLSALQRLKEVRFHYDVIELKKQLKSPLLEVEEETHLTGGIL